MIFDKNNYSSCACWISDDYSQLELHTLLAILSTISYPTCTRGIIVKQSLVLKILYFLCDIQEQSTFNITVSSHLEGFGTEIITTACIHIEKGGNYKNLRLGRGSEMGILRFPSTFFSKVVSSYCYP